MRKWLIYGIIALGFILRVTALSSYPTGFTPDEASFGYDAYSIIKTGKDQWGHSFPIVLQSFGDYKLPLYSYLATPFIALFGLSKFSVRLPNALAGTLAIYITYLMVQEITKTTKASKKMADFLSISSALLLSISPWHVMMSRGAFEANLTTLFMPLGIYLFLRSFSNNANLIVSALVFGLNLFSYHSARLVTPLIVGFVIILFWNDLKKVPNNTKLISGVLFSFFILLTIYSFALGGATRATSLNIFSGASQQAAPERLLAIESGIPPIVARVFHNKYLVYIERFVDNYTQYTSYKFLFNDGPSEATYGMMPGFGVLYWFELPFMFAFPFAFITFKQKKIPLFALIWILVSPLPTALATGWGYAGNRAAIMMPGIQIMSAVGAFVILDFLSVKLNRKAVKKTAIIYGLAALSMFAIFLERYFVISPYKNAEAMLFGRLEVAERILNSNESKDIYVSNSLSEPHIYFAFASKLNPSDFQSSAKSWNFEETGLLFVDQMNQYSLDDIIFTRTFDHIEQGVLIGKPDEFYIGVSPRETIYYPNGEEALYIVER